MKRISISLSVLVWVLLVVCPGAHGGQIPIVNAGFEDPAQDDGDWVSADVVPGWSGGYYDLTDPTVWVASDGDSGVYDPNAVDHGFGGDAPEGENVAWTTAFVGYDLGLAQVLSTNLKANTQYDLSVLVGNPALYNATIGPGPTADWRIELLAGGVVLDSSTGPSPVDDQTWTTASLTFNSGANPPQVGQPLEIRLLAVDFDDWYEVDFDDVALTPEPATMTMLALMGLGVYTRRRKR